MFYVDTNTSASTIVRSTNTHTDLPRRRRKWHSKSRSGCGNCKTRRIKCDEASPSCKRCAAANLVCNYDESVSALHNKGVHEFQVEITTSERHRRPPSTQVYICLKQSVSAGGVDHGSLQALDLAALNLYTSRTAQTVGSPSTCHMYNAGSMQLAAQTPFLLHIFITLSLLHDMFLEPAKFSAAHRSALAAHWSRGTALFNRLLSKSPTSLTEAERDAVWSAATLLGTASYACIDTADPHQAWPLRTDGHLVLDWLKMGYGKKVIWDITKPTRPESTFHSLVPHMTGPEVPNGEAKIAWGALPPLFYSVFELSPLNSDFDINNPYYTAASIMAQLFYEQLAQNNVHRFLAFVSQIDKRFKCLLEERDHRALLLLAYWYTKMATSPIWWQRRRAMVEGLGICIYLERHCSEVSEILSLLSYPRAIFEAAIQAEATRDIDANGSGQKQNRGHS